MLVLFHKTVIVAVVGGGQATAVYRIDRGVRVRGASLAIKTSADGGATSTWSLGDSGSATRFINALSCVGAVGLLVDGSVASYLYVARDTISLTYTPGGGPGATAPIAEVLLELESVWPKTA